jgi:acyl carrier protein
MAIFAVRHGSFIAPSSPPSQPLGEGLRTAALGWAEKSFPWGILCQKEGFALTMDETPLHRKVKELIINRLQLEGITPEDIDNAAPLFGDGLGLDSIDALELVIGIEKEFGVRIQDEEVGTKAFASVNALVDFLRSKGVQEAA